MTPQYKDIKGFLENTEEIIPTTVKILNKPSGVVKKFLNNERFLNKIIIDIINAKNGKKLRMPWIVSRTLCKNPGRKIAVISVAYAAQ
ncbi:MAG: hypothetical protein ABSF55_00980, partial [Candidatus Staskawiczbacteria bacterium]